MMSELTVLDPSAGLKAKKSDALRKTWCEWEGRGGGPRLQVSPSREDEHEEVRIWRFCAFHGVVKNEPYLNIPIAGFRANWCSSKNKSLPH